MTSAERSGPSPFGSWNATNGSPISPIAAWWRTTISAGKGLPRNTGSGGNTTSPWAPARFSSLPHRTASAVKLAMTPDSTGHAPSTASRVARSTSSCSSRVSDEPSLASMLIAIAVGRWAAIHR